MKDYTDPHNFADARRHLNLSQSEWASMLGIQDVRTLRRMEKGQRPISTSVAKLASIMVGDSQYQKCAYLIAPILGDLEKDIDFPLRFLRKLRKISTQEMADCVGVSRQNYVAIESGKISPPDGRFIMYFSQKIRYPYKHVADILPKSQAFKNRYG